MWDRQAGCWYHGSHAGKARFCNLLGERLLLGIEGASALDEQEAIRFCQGGDKESFRVLVEKHQEKAYKAARMILGDPGAAEDVVQDAFLAAWRSINTFKLGLPFAPWLYKIVVRCAVRSMERKSIRMTSLQDSCEIELSDPSPGPEQALKAAELKEVLGNAISRLSPHRKLIITLHYYVGQKICEIAESLGLPEGTVKSEIFRARQELSQTLREVFCDEVERTKRK